MEPQEIKVQKTLFDLHKFDDVLLVKIGTFEPVSVENATKEALQRVNGDTAQLAAIINDGLKARAMQQLRESADSWHTFKVDAEGEYTDEINGPFEGQVADSKMVNNLVLSLSKTIFGFSKDLTKEQKKQAKANAMEMIKNTPAIREGLSKNAALTASEE